MHRFIRLTLAVLLAAVVSACAQQQTTGYMGGSPGMTTTYAITFRNFTTREIMAVTDVMEREFPHYVTARAPTGDTAIMRYGYVSQAPANKIQRWLYITLTDLGLDPDRNVKMIVNQTAIDLDKIY